MVIETEQQKVGQSMERLLRLQRVTSGLSRALTPMEVARVIVLRAGPALGAAECSVYLRDDGRLRLVEVVGMPQVDFEPWRLLPLELPVPIAEAARTGAPVWVESLEALRGRYPAVDGVALRGQRAWASLPLEVEGRVLGVLTLGFEREQGFEQEDKEFACVVAQQCAYALERAHLYARERALREEAEAQRREAEAQRREAEREHQSLLQVLLQMPQAVVLAQAPSGRRVLTNARAERLRGRSAPSEWHPEDYTSVRGFHADGRPYQPDEWPLSRALTRGEEVRGEVIDILLEEGTPRTIEVSAGPVRDAEGRVTAAVALFDDITERLRMEGALREGEAVFRRIMESDMMGLAFCDEGGRILQANEAFLSLVGHRMDELARGELQWQAMVPPQGREAGDEALRELWSRGVSSAFELELLRGDGSRVPVLTGSARVEEQARVLSFVMDLSDLKRAEGALRFLATASRILGQSPEVPDTTLQHVACLASVSVASWCVIDLVDAETGTVRRAAAAHRDQEQEAWLRETWPSPPPSDSGGPLLDAMHSGEPLLFTDFSAETWRHLSPESEPMLRPSGWEACSVVVVPLRSHEGALGLLTLGACTPPQRRYGAEDVAMGQELAYRVATALEGARLFQDSQRAVRLRDEFLAVASHELKTPLTPLRLHLQGLRRVVEGGAGQPVEAERVLRAVHGCEAQVRKLAGLVNDLLDVSRLAKGQLPLNLEPVDLLAVTRDVVEQLAPEAARARCRVEVREGPPVVGRWDRVRLEQVVTNLLTNALKYGARKPVVLRAWREGGVARLLVRDEGIGIEPEHRARIFGKFERAVSDRHYGGLGLGLHITQRIVHALGGEILLESEPGRGASFTVELPLEGAPRVREVEEERLPP
jgi:PAS domain S-box-containing protein